MSKPGHPSSLFQPAGSAADGGGFDATRSAAWSPLWLEVRYLRAGPSLFHSGSLW